MVHSFSLVELLQIVSKCPNTELLKLTVDSLFIPDKGLEITEQRKLLTVYLPMSLGTTTSVGCLNLHSTLVNKLDL